jgi:hypothetical protein
MKKQFTKLLAVVVVLLLGSWNLIAQDASVLGTFASGWANQTFNTGTENQIYMFHTGASVSSGTVNCFGSSAGRYSIRPDSNGDYFEVQLNYAGTQKLIDQVSFSVTANSTTAGYVGHYGWSLDGTTWTNGAQFSMPVTSAECATYTVAAPAGLFKYFRIMRNSSSTNWAGTLGGGQTIRIYSIQVWTKSNCTAPTSYSVSGTAAICSGSSTDITLSGSQSGVTYQLLKGGVAEGETTAGTGSALTWTVSAIGTYTVTTTTAAGYCATVMANNAVVTLKSAPNINSQSTAAAVYGQGFGSPSPLTITATGNGLTYQWYSNTSASNSGGTIIDGQTASSYTPSTAVMGTTFYYCVVSGDCTPTSTSAVSGAIEIITACTAPTFSAQPTDNQSECIDGVLTLGTVAADQSPSYQWYSNSSKLNYGGTLIEGATNTTYTPASTVAGTYYYYVVATNGACPTPSNAVQIIVHPATSVSVQPAATTTFGLNATATALNVTAIGSSLTYQWYSNASASNTGGTIIDAATSNTYTPATTALGTTYYYCVVSGGCAPSSVPSNVAEVIIVQFQDGDYKSVASANWGVASTWNKWSAATSSWSVVDFPNAATANVYIQGGFTVNSETSARSIKNLYISGNSTLKSSNLVNTPNYLKVYGTTVSVEPGSIIGNTSTGNNADGISLGVYTTSLTITGGGIVNLSRLQVNLASSEVIIDNNVTINYHGSGNAGNAGGFYSNGTFDNTTLTVNAGKTLTFAPWSCITPVSSSHAQGAVNQTYNINGTLTFVDGLVPGNATANGWTGHTNNYMSLAVTGKTVNLNIGATGTLNASEFYPNGTKADNSLGGGDITNVTIAAGGVINVSKIADLRKNGQLIAGEGTFNILAGAVLRIGSADGITTSGATGSVQSATRTFNSSADYQYEGSVAQVTGNGLPASINSMLINNTNGVSLSGSNTVNSTLTLTAGKLNLGANDLTISGTGTISGGSATSYIVTDGAGNVTLPTASSVATLIPIGASATSYDPVSVTPTTGTNFAAKVYSTLSGSAVYGVRYNPKEWNITPEVSSSTVIALTPSVLNESIASPVIGHYVSSAYINSSATMINAGTTYTGTFDTFSPFVTGANIDVTSLSIGSNSDISVYTVDKLLYVNGLNTGDIVNVYSVNGQKVAQRIATTNTLSTPLQKGAYVIIIKTAGNVKTIKTIVE